VGDWLVEPELDRITNGSASAYLRPQVMELLVYMARHGNCVVSAEDLHDNLWTGKVVGSGTVYNCVAELRHTLTGDDNLQSYIETIPKKGYRLVAPITAIAEPQTANISGSTHEWRHHSIISKYRVVVSIVATAIVALGAVFLSHLVSQENQSAVTPDRRSVQTFKLDIPESIRLMETGRNPIDISSDGQRVVFRGIADGRSQLFSRSIDSLAVRPIEGAEQTSVFAATFDLSPDDQWIAYQGKNALLQKVHVNGGIPVTLCDPVGLIRDISWGPNGQIYWIQGL
jgi:DNA-binding winged helix-turn-helix (wHTH) protein